MSKGGSTTVSTPTLPAEYKPYVGKLLDQAYGSLGTKGTGQLVAGSNANIEQGQNMALDAARTQLPQLYQQQQGIFGNLASAGNWQNNPALQQQMQQIAQNAQQNLQENVLPSLRTGAVQAGQVGSSRQGIAEGIAARDMARNVSQQQTGLLSNAYNQSIGANQAALGYAPQMAQAALQPSSIFGGVGAQQRDIQQQQLQERLMQQNAELARLQGLSGIQQNALNPLVGNKTSTPSESWKTGDWLQAGLGAGMMAFSDARLKKNLVPVGMHAGVTVYEWVWNSKAAPLGLVGKAVGVLAQEVEKVLPHLVVSNYRNTGYKAVNYGGLAEIK